MSAESSSFGSIPSSCRAAGRRHGRSSNIPERSSSSRLTTAGGSEWFASTAPLLVGSYSSCPAGTREPPEPAAACAARELGEEMGLTAARWFPLMEMFSSPGFCTELLSVFVALDVRPSVGRPEDDESIQREWIDVSEWPI